VVAGGSTGRNATTVLPEERFFATLRKGLANKHSRQVADFDWSLRSATFTRNARWGTKPHSTPGCRDREGIFSDAMNSHVVSSLDAAIARWRARASQLAQGDVFAPIAFVQSGRRPRLMRKSLHAFRLGSHRGLLAGRNPLAKRLAESRCRLGDELGGTLLARRKLAQPAGSTPASRTIGHLACTGRYNSFIAPTIRCSVPDVLNVAIGSTAWRIRARVRAGSRRSASTICTPHDF